MMLKVYRITVVDNDLADYLKAKGMSTYFDMVAHDLPSAWRKFGKQRFPGVSAPNPSYYDIRLDRLIRAGIMDRYREELASKYKLTTEADSPSSS